MAQKNIKVSELVHEKLERRKTEDQTFDDVLREMLDLTPDLDDMVAYFSPEHAEAAKRVVSTIEEQGEFESAAQETDHDQRLDFISPDSDLSIARATFTENRMQVYYRDQHGDMTRIGTVKETDEGDVYSYINSRYDGIEEICKRVRKKVAGAYRKWG